MKKLVVLCAFILGMTLPLRAITIASWDFNSPIPDATVATGTLTPVIGSGTLTNIGTSGTFGNPTNAATFTSSSDPAVGDDSGLRMDAFPAQGTLNKTAGIQLFVSTVGYEGITMTFDQENSATASRYWRTQYTTNGSTWVDYVVLESAGPSLTTTWLNNRIVDLSTVAGVKNNPNFGFRYVSEWISTATGSGADQYLGNSGNYGVNGTLWLDMVSVSGVTLNTNNTDPVISSITNQSVRVNQTTGPIPFTIGDLETATANLNLSFLSSNPSLISDFSFGGSGANRTITLNPVANQSGSATITVTVTDEGGKGASSVFSVTVLPPTVIVSNQTLRVNTSRSVGIQVSQYASFLGPVTISATAVNGFLLPEGSLVLSGTGSNRSLTITPAPDVIDRDIITITATDGALTATGTIFLNVVASNTVAFWDFNSALRDFNVQTGRTNANLGTGEVKALVAVGSFGSVAGLTSDLDGEDNSRFRLGDTQPAQNTSNKMAGAEWRVSTVGYQDIGFSWNHYNSASASRYYRVQYSTDGVSFIDALSFSNLLATTGFPMATSFTGFSGVDNNPNFAVRLVSEFESTAVLGSTNGYVGVSTNYGSAGTLWLDTITFTGNPFTGVSQATLSIVTSGNNVLVSWPDNSTGTLEYVLTLGAVWQPVSETPVQANGKYTVTIPASGTAKFFRLHQ